MNRAALLFSRRCRSGSKPREETARHLAAGATPPVDAQWVQLLADLLATERSWQDQYTELIALGSAGGQFPSSNR